MEPEPEHTKGGGFSLRFLTRLLAVTLVVCVAAELILRALVTMPEHRVFDPLLPNLRDPGATVLFTREGFARRSVNSLGLLDDEPLGDAGTEHILVLGDSFTEAAHVPQAETFVARMQAASDGMDFLNAGHAGFALQHYPEMSRRLNERLPISKIVVMLNFGDIDDLLADKRLDIQRDEASGRVTKVQLKSRPRSFAKEAVRAVVSHSALLTLGLQRLRLVVEKSSASLSEPLSWLLRKLGFRQSLADTASRRGGNRLQPEDAVDAACRLLRDLNEQAPTTAAYLPQMDFLSAEGPRETERSRTTQGKLSAAAACAGVNLTSLTELLVQAHEENHRPPVGFHNNVAWRGHLNEIGHEAVARALLQVLESDGTGGPTPQ